MTNVFEVMGLPPRYVIDRAELDRRYKALQKAHHPDRHSDKLPSERRSHVEQAMKVNEAYKVLKDDVARAEAVMRALGQAVDHGESRPSNPDFLMEMMELQEEVAAARLTEDEAELDRLRTQMQESKLRLLSKIEQKLDQARDFAGAEELLERVRYFERVLQGLE